MKKNFTSFLTKGALFIAAISSLSYSSYTLLNRQKAGITEEKRRQYEHYLAENVYGRADKDGGKEAEENGKLDADNPREAILQDFYATMDPKLKRPAPERLANVYKIVEKQHSARTSSAFNWVERGPSNVGGRTEAIMFDPNDATHKKVWAGGVSGGLWYCNDITATTPAWNKVNDFWANLAVTSLAYSNSNKQVFYAGTGEGWYNSDAVQGNGVWKTTDGGATWTQLASTSNSNFYHIQKVMVHPTTGDVYAATRENGFMRSQDGGTSWTQVLGTSSGGLQNAAADMEIGADGTIYASLGLINSGDGEAYSSSTGNVNSWTKLNTGTNGFPGTGIQRIELAAAPGNANILYALVEGSGAGVKSIYKSADKGANWTAIGQPQDADSGIPGTDFSRGQAWYDLSAAVDPNNANTLFVGGVDLFKTTNAGTTWTQISHWYGGFSYPYVHADQHIILFSPGSSSVMLFGNDGGIFYTTNATVAAPAFTDRDNGYNVTQFYSCAMDPTAGANYFLAGAQDNGSYQFTTAGVNAASQVTSGDGAYCFIDQDNPAIQITSYVYNNYYLSTDGGTSFGTNLNNDGNTGKFINPCDYDDRANILFSAYSTSQVLAIASVGLSPGTPTPFTITGLGSMASHIRVSPYASLGTSTIFVGTDAGRLFKVTGAESASPNTTEITGAGFPTGNVSCVEIGASENELLVTFSNYGVISVWYTADGGASWANKEGNLPDMPVRWALFNPNNRKEVLLATEVGTWSSGDISVASPSWAAAGSGMANVRTDMLKIRASDNEVIAATHGRGLFSTDAFLSAPKATALFTANKTTVCEGGSITFTSQSTNSPATYLWAFPGATPTSSSSATPPSIQYPNTGQYTVTLIVSKNGIFDTLTRTSYITVNALPNTSAITGTATICANTTATYSVTPTANSTYNWTITGGTIQSGNGTNMVTVNWTTAGSGNVNVIETNSNGCPGSQVSANVNVNAAPNTSAISGINSVCPNTTTTYSVTPTANSTYNWSITGGSIQSGNGTNMVTVNWPTAGNGSINVTETNSNGCAGNQVSANITINPIPNTSAINGSTVVCTNTTTTYAVTPTANSTYNWAVTGGAIQSGNGTNMVTVSWTMAGGGNINVTETNSGGCSGSQVSANVTVNLAPNTSAITGPTAICTNTPATYSVSTTSGSTYNWSITGGTIQSGNGTNSVSAIFTGGGADNISVVETNSNGCQGNTVSATVNVTAPPTPDFTMSNDTIQFQAGQATATFTNASTGGATSYKWYFGDGTGTSMQTSPTYTYTATGTYTVKLVATNACGSDSVSKTIVVRPGTNGVANLAAQNTSIILYPNPATDKVFYKFPENSINNSIAVYDMSGKKMKSENNVPAESFINVGGFADGYYIIKATCSAGSFEQNIVIKR